MPPEAATIAEVVLLAPKRLQLLRGVDAQCGLNHITDACALTECGEEGLPPRYRFPHVT
jgi:hypothetical protein